MVTEMGPSQIRSGRPRLFKSSPYFLSQRVGRWQWPWFLLGLLAGVAALAIYVLVVTAATELLLRSNGGWAQELGTLLQNLFESDDSSTASGEFIAELALVVGGPFWVFAIAGSLVQGRSIGSLIAPLGKIRWRIVGAVLLVEAIAILAITLVDVFAFGTEYEFAGFDGGDAIWLVPALLAVLVQTSGEDVLFKGYLLRQFGALTKVLWIAPTAVIALFILGHLGNEDLQVDVGVIFVAFILSEIAIVYLLMHTGGMEVPLVMHWTNNAFIFVVLAERKTQSKDLTLFVFDDDLSTTSDNRVGIGLFLAGLVVKLVAFTWRRSPFYLEPHKGLAQTPPGSKPVSGPLSGQDQSVSVSH